MKDTDRIQEDWIWKGMNYEKTGIAGAGKQP